MNFRMKYFVTTFLCTNEKSLNSLLKDCNDVLCFKERITLCLVTLI